MTQPDPLADLLARERAAPEPDAATKARVREDLARRLGGGGPPPASDAPATLGSGSSPALVGGLAVAGVAAVVVAAVVMLSPGAPPETASVDTHSPNATTDPPSSPPAPVPVPVPEATTGANEPVLAPETVPETSDDTDGTPRREARPTAKPKPQSRPDSKPASKPGFAEEYALVQSIVADLDAGRARAALRKIEKHRRDFPRGQLIQERESARVSALCKLGRAQAAAEAADAFVKRFPNSTHRAKVERGCAP